jgi:hypothetical protein
VARNYKVRWIAVTTRRMFHSWKSYAFRIGHIRRGFVSRLQNFLYLYQLRYIFSSLKRRAYTTNIAGKLSVYIKRVKLNEPLDLWKKSFWKRAQDRQLMSNIISYMHRNQCDLAADKLRHSFMFWRVVVFQLPRLDLLSLGKTCFRSWCNTYSAVSFNKQYIQKLAFRAWCERVNALCAMRPKVLRMRKGCAILESRLLFAAILFYFS